MLTKKQIKRRLTYIIENFKIEENLDKIRSFNGIATAEGTKAWDRDGNECFIYIARNIKGERFSSMIVFSEFVFGETIVEKYAEIDDKLRYWEKAIVANVLKIASYDAKLCEKYEMDNFLTKHFSDEKTK